MGIPGPTGPTGPAGTIGILGDRTQMAFPGQHAPDCIIGDVKLTAGSTASGVPAEGQLLSIASNTALFSLIGTNFGGNGSTNFALPDLTDAAPDGMTYYICTQGIYPSRL
jgi:microcystin-dependent protein